MSIWMPSPVPSRRATSVVAAVLAAALLAAPAAPAAADVRAGDRASELVNVSDERGRKMRLRAYRGKWVVLTFGASWCAPCRRELPAYEKLAREYKKQGADVVFVAINVDEDRAAGQAFMKRLGLRAMVVGYDPDQSTVKVYNPPSMPTTFVISPQGVVRHMHRGYERGDDAKLRAELGRLMKRSR
jgi:thiol-disulfide isomerase/thioredoxin